MIGYKLKYFDPYSDTKIYTVVGSNSSGIILQSEHKLLPVNHNDIRDYIVIEDYDGERTVPDNAYLQKFVTDENGEELYITPEQYNKKKIVQSSPQPPLGPIDYAMDYNVSDLLSSDYDELNSD